MNNDDAELIHQDHVLRSFNAYRYAHLQANNLRRQAYANLSMQHQALLPDQPKLLNKIDHCIVANAEFLEDISKYAQTDSMLSLSPPPTSSSNFNSSSSLLPINGAPPKSKSKPKITENEMDKLRSTLRQLHRDWSKEGEDEREKAYRPIVDSLLRHAKQLINKGEIASMEEFNVLVPGCGLGRLPFEIARTGLSCQGNEFSLYMLHTANYILNATHQAEEFTIHPFCHTLSNISTAEGATREIRIPDILPAAEEGLNLSMATGDFLEIYRDDTEEWSAIVTCFFIDTAHNVIDYLETIKRLLKPNGIWINLGPSLWHFEGNSSGSIDLPMTEVKRLAERIGFKLDNEDEIELTYTSNPQSCMRYTYKASFWTATLQ